MVSARGRGTISYQGSGIRTAGGSPGAWHPDPNSVWGLSAKDGADRLLLGTETTPDEGDAGFVHHRIVLIVRPRRRFLQRWVSDTGTRAKVVHAGSAFRQTWLACLCLNFMRLGGFMFTGERLLRRVDCAMVTLPWGAVVPTGTQPTVATSGEPLPILTL